MSRDQELPGIMPLERLPSGIPGLDDILSGGFFRGGIYIVQGRPGSGKTILGNQLCFNHVAAGGQALYVTLLAESHSRMLSHLGGMSFFRAETIARSLHYLSAFKTLEEDGLRGLLTLVRREIVARQTTLLVLDGLIQAGETASTATEFKKFIHELQTQAAVTDCTMFLLTSAGVPAVTPEHTMVDGMIVLADEFYGWRAQRDLTVTKFRGGSTLRGRHAFRISDDGITAFPRLEALHKLPSDLGGGERPRLSSGVLGFDALMGGGVPCGSNTLVLGPTGSGKTTFGLQFLSQSTPEQPGLLFGFCETPPRLLRKSAKLSPPLGPLVESGAVQMVWQPPTAGYIDEVGLSLLEAVRKRKVKRLFLDGLGEFPRMAVQPERTLPFLTALTNELRALGVTTVSTLEIPDLVGPMVRAPFGELTLYADNMVLLRYIQHRTTLNRIVSVLKVRDSACDPSVREFQIGEHGIELLGDVERAEALFADLGPIVQGRPLSAGDPGSSGR